MLLSLTKPSQSGGEAGRTIQAGRGCWAQPSLANLAGRGGANHPSRARPTTNPRAEATMENAASLLGRSGTRVLSLTKPTQSDGARRGESSESSKAPRCERVGQGC